MKVVIAVSGTGGHIYPGISVGKKLRAEGNEVVFIGSKNNITESILNKSGFDFKLINVVGWQRRKFLTLIHSLLKLITAIFKMIKLIKVVNPELVVGMGGYVSIPVIIAASFLRKKIIIHEQNASPGLANRILSKFADIVALGFDEAKIYFKKTKVVFVGNPIREEFNNVTRETARNYFKLSDESKVIFVFGGSQGAYAINRIVLESVIKLEVPNLSIIHVTGKNDYNAVKDMYKDLEGLNVSLYKYLDEIYYAYFACDVVISRSGALSCQEIIATNCNAILIPYPYSTDNHQMKNALVLKKIGVANIIEEKNLNESIMVSSIENILNNRNEKIRDYSKKNGVDDFVRLCKEIV